MRPSIAMAVLQLAYSPPATYSEARAKAQAISIVKQATEVGALRRPRWWQWSSWLACALTIRRIENA